MSDLHQTIDPALSIEGRALRVTRYELVEGLSELSRLACELFDDEAPLPRPGDVVGKKAVFTLARSDGSDSRTFVGTIVRAELAPDADDVPSLRLVVAPRLWNLGKRKDCRIFQEMSAVDIVKKVLVGAGVPASAQEWRLGEDHPKRTHVAQYRETDLDFMMRLLAEEGIWFALSVKDEEDRIIFSDATDGLGEVAGATTLSYVEEFGFDGPADRVHRLERSVSVKSDKVFLRDYDPDKPRTLVEGQAEGTDEGSHALEVYEYPARSSSAGEAKRRAKVLVDSMQAERDVLTGETSSLALLPGHRFSVYGHPYDPLNQEYMVTGTRIEGSRPRSFAAGTAAQSSTLRIAFRAVPTGSTRYRPPRKKREQTVAGTQTAFTTGASGQEIHTDAAGRVKVSYHWDRSGKKDDTSSLWIRTLQLPTGGSMLLPRVGWEVTVAHEGGDVDRPLVLGRMYNPLAPPPYALPKHAARSALQTATSPGGGSANEVRMTDTKGSEQMYLNASRDMTTQVNNNATESIANDHKKAVGANQSKNVTNSVTENVGSNQTLDVGGNQSVKVETFMVDEVGSHALTIGGNRDMKVGGDHNRDVGGASKLSVGGNEIDLVVGSVTEKTLGSFKHDVGAALVELSVGDRTVTVGANRSESAGAAKVIATNGGRGVEVGTSFDVKVVGAVVNIADGDRAEEAGGTFTEIAAGAQMVQADKVIFEAKDMLTVVMGASIVSLTPATVAILGVSAKLDGDVSDLAALIVDN
jgi:type VI secretion system secreted protein VgrG